MIRRNRSFPLAGAVLLAGALLAGCSSTDDAAPSPSASATAASSAAAGTGTAPLPTGGAELATSSWALSGAATTTEDLSGSGITLEFAADTASGNGGVNTYTAGYTATAQGELTFSEIASTMMAGDDAAMTQEAAYFKALGSVTGYSVSGDLLDLFAGPDQVLTFTRS